MQEGRRLPGGLKMQRAVRHLLGVKRIVKVTGSIPSVQAADVPI
jgi:hypothetical protein